MATTKPKRKLAVIKNVDVVPAGLTDIAAAQTLEGAKNQGALRKLPIDQIARNPKQPRELGSKGFSPESLTELADTISAQGVIQPIVVRRAEQGYEIVAGERRWRAAQIAGLKQIPAVIRDVDDKTMRLMAFIENFQREDLNPMEQAAALENIKQDGDYTNDQLGKIVGRAKSTITVTLSLLRLAPEVQDLVRQRRLDPSLARSLVNLPNYQQVNIARRAVAQGWTARRMEQEKARLTAEKVGNTEPEKRPVDPNILSLETNLSELYGVRINIKPKKKGKGGQIIINYSSLDECDGIIARMGYQQDS